MIERCLAAEFRKLFSTCTLLGKKVYHQSAYNLRLSAESHNNILNFLLFKHTVYHKPCVVKARWVIEVRGTGVREDGWGSIFYTWTTCLSSLCDLQKCRLSLWHNDKLEEAKSQTCITRKQPTRKNEWTLGCTTIPLLSVPDKNDCKAHQTHHRWILTGEFAALVALAMLSTLLSPRHAKHEKHFG